MVSVVMTERDIRQAAANAVERRIERMRGGAGERYAPQGAKGLGVDFLGALGEFAVAKYLGLFPSGYSQAGASDVGPFEVRTVESAALNLLIYPQESAPVVLAVVANPFREPVTLAGWGPAGELKRPEYWRTDGHRPAFWVPPAALRPMDELRAALERGAGVLF